FRVVLRTRVPKRAFLRHEPSLRQNVSDKFGARPVDAVCLRVCRVRGVDFTCARSTVRPLTPPYLRQTDFPHRVNHVDGPIVRGREDVTAISTSAI
ncbi:hypothetical protein BHE74_00043076, partial [Ensete ventricosum]